MNTKPDAPPVFSGEVVYELQRVLKEIIDSGGFGKIHIEICAGRVKLVTVEKSVMIKREP